MCLACKTCHAFRCLCESWICPFPCFSNFCVAQEFSFLLHTSCTLWFHILSRRYCRWFVVRAMIGSLRYSPLDLAWITLGACHGDGPTKNHSERPGHSHGHGPGHGRGLGAFALLGLAVAVRLVWARQDASIHCPLAVRPLPPLVAVAVAVTVAMAVAVRLSMFEHYKGTTRCCGI